MKKLLVVAIMLVGLSSCVEMCPGTCTELRGDVWVTYDCEVYCYED